MLSHVSDIFNLFYVYAYTETRMSKYTGVHGKTRTRFLPECLNEHTRMLRWSNRPPRVIAAGTVSVDVHVLHDCAAASGNQHKNPSQWMLIGAIGIKLGIIVYSFSNYKLIKKKIHQDQQNSQWLQPQPKLEKEQPSRSIPASQYVT